MHQSFFVRRAALSAALLALVAGAAQAQTKIKTKSSAGKEKITVSTTGQSGVGVTLANLDRSVAPCDDFFRFANGNWMKNNPIPASETGWGSFNQLRDRNRGVARRILEKAAADRTAKPGSNMQKVGDFYAAAMDSVAVEKAGLKYLQPRLNQISAIQDVAGVQAYLANPKNIGKGWYGFGVGQDGKNSSVYAVQLRQGGLTLPNRDYYLKEDARSKTIRAAYRTYQTNLFKLLGDDQATAEKNADAVTRLETRMAKASRDPVALRDRESNYNKMSVDKAVADYPNLNLPLRLKESGLSGAKEIIVGQPDYLKEASAMLKEEPVADQKQYLRWHLVESVVSALPKAFVDEEFRFSKVVSGAKQPQPRWRRAFAATDGSLGEAFGQIYVDEDFSPAAKARAKQLVENLRVAYAERIQATDWMSAATKAEALKKLNAFVVKIGYPDKWKDYSKLSVSRESALNNLFAAADWGTQDNLSKFGQPVDRSVWGMTPPTVNAYYSPSLNEIVFPAGILQAPFYDPKADDAVNYGGIGAVIGHEMTHGFDDQGRKVDSQGNLRDWWTKEDRARFQAKADALVAQYNGYSPLPGYNVNGALTLGENIGDNSGVAIAYKAYKLSLNGKPAPVIDGFTGDQRFFMGFGQVWRMKMREEQQIVQVKTDPHSPGQFRTNGTMVNQPGFYEAFGVKPGDKMYVAPEKRVIIW